MENYDNAVAKLSDLVPTSVKARVILFGSALILIGSLPGCSSPGLKTKTGTGDQPPVTLGQADFDPGSDDRTNAIPTSVINYCHLSLLWIKGTHTLHDPAPWCGDGEKYNGKFIFRVTLTDKRVVDTPLESLFPDGDFNSFYVAEYQPWPIKMADYNNDGQLDFNIVTYGSCLTSECYFFTVTPSGKVEALKVEGTGSLEINSLDRRDIQSTGIFGNQLTAGGFYNEFYDRRGLHGPELHWESLDWDSRQKVFHQQDQRIQLRQ